MAGRELSSLLDDGFRLLAETTTAAFVVYDARELLYANTAFGTLTGLPIESVVGRPDVWRLIVDDDREMVLQRLQDRLAGLDVPTHYRFRIRHQDGSLRWVEASATRVPHHDEAVGLATLIDVTHTVSAEHRVDQQAAFEQLVLRISRQFLGLPTDRFYDGVASALRALGEYTAIDRLTFFVSDDGGERFRLSYVWNAVGSAVDPATLPEFGAEQFPWGLGRLRRLEPVEIPRVSALPSEAEAERTFFTAAGIRSVLSIPVAHHRRLLGFLGLEMIRAERTWSLEQRTLLKVVGQILAGALVRNDAETALAKEKERALVTLATIAEGVVRTDASGLVEYLNPAAERLTGWSSAAACGRLVSDVYTVVEENTGRPRTDPIGRCLRLGRPISTPGLSTLLGRAGHERTVRDSASPIQGPDGTLIGSVLVFEDVSEVRGLEREMAFLASHDALTGLANRVEVEIHLEAALEAARDHDTRAALIKIDLVHFKLVNDAGGHVAGDALLCQIAEMLREQTAEAEVLARVGGDEFAILVSDPNGERARQLANRVLSSLRPYRFSWGGQRYDVSASVGLVRIDTTTDSVGQILKAADVACHLARESGSQRVHEYTRSDLDAIARSGQVRWVHRIRRALDEDRMCLYRQRIAPIGEAHGGLHEILVRLVDEHGRHIEPARFIPIAEQYRLGPALDRWVVRRTLGALADSGAADLGQDPVTINLSGQSLDDESFLDFVIERVDASTVDPARLFFEITETAAVGHLARAVGFIGALRDRGCRFILDDFGSGVSSFAYLKNLPVDLLKIDGAFVRSMEHDPVQRAMVRSIHQIGHLMGLGTIAEWVENAATYDMVRDLEIDYVQGFYVHRPEPLVA